MFRVDSRFAGQGLWNSGALPVPLQAALGLVRTLQGGRFADDARIVPAAPTQLVDRRV